VAVRCEADVPAGRYLSNNNANIARLDLIGDMFPDASIPVPIRNPFAHAASLHRQHSRFLELHANDPFAMRYMADIGHFEFGALHRPIHFDGFEELSAGLEPTDLDYWLAYWIAAFEHIAAHRSHVHLVSYDDLCSRDNGTAALLCEWLGIEAWRAPEIGAYFRPQSSPTEALDTHRSAYRGRAEDLYRNLLAK